MSQEQLQLPINDLPATGAASHPPADPASRLRYLPFTRWIRGTLSRRLAFAFTSLLFLVSLLFAILFMFTWNRASTGLLLRWNSQAVDEFIRRGSPLLAEKDGPNNFLPLRDLAYDLQARYDGIDIYLLDRNGLIVADFVERPLVGDTRIPIDALRKELLTDRSRQQASTIIQNGYNPLKPLVGAPVAIAPISLFGEPGYVYMTLVGKGSVNVLELILESAGIRLAVALFIGLNAAAIIAGVLVIRFATARFYRIANALRRYAEGDRTVKVHDERDDDLGEVSRSINSLVEAISGQVDELSAKDELRRQLIMNVWHDLRGPITAIRGNMELLRDRDERYDAQKRMAVYGAIESSTQLLAQLLSELHELARLEARESAPSFVRCEVEPFLEDILSTFTVRASEANVTLRAGSIDAERDGWCDEGMIARVLQNLIDNAIRHTPQGGTVEVNVRTQPETGRIELSVSDNGEGMEDDVAARIFERSFQAAGDGLRGVAGLGLAIAKRIVEAHCGEITVTSRRGAGTVFAFTIASYEESSRGSEQGPHAAETASH